MGTNSAMSRTGVAKTPRMWRASFAGRIAMAVFVGIGIAGLIGCGRAGDVPAKVAGQYRLATLNVEHLAGPMDPEPSDGNHLTALAAMIRDTDADLLALQGVQSLEAVQWFVNEYLDGAGYEYVVSLDVDHDRGLENALLSRVPTETSRVWPSLALGGRHPALAGDVPNPNAGQPIRFRRSPLMVQVVLPGDPTALTVIIVEHKGGDRFGYWREAEAKAITTLAAEIGMNQRIIVLGSFHAPIDEPALYPYFESGFFDALDRDGTGDPAATELSGDRTDFVLANRAALGSLDGENAFVISRQAGSSDLQSEHFPVGIGIRSLRDE